MPTVEGLGRSLASDCFQQCPQALHWVTSTGLTGGGLGPSVRTNLPTAGPAAVFSPACYWEFWPGYSNGGDTTTAAVGAKLSLGHLVSSPDG